MVWESKWGGGRHGEIWFGKVSGEGGGHGEIWFVKVSGWSIFGGCLTLVKCKRKLG